MIYGKFEITTTCRHVLKGRQEEDLWVSTLLAKVASCLQLRGERLLEVERKPWLEEDALHLPWEGRISPSSSLVLEKASPSSSLLLAMVETLNEHERGFEGLKREANGVAKGLWKAQVILHMLSMPKMKKMEGVSKTKCRWERGSFTLWAWGHGYGGGACGELSKPMGKLALKSYGLWGRWLWARR